MFGSVGVSMVVVLKRHHSKTQTNVFFSTALIEKLFIFNDIVCCIASRWMMKCSSFCIVAISPFNPFNGPSLTITGSPFINDSVD